MRLHILLRGAGGGGGGGKESTAFENGRCCELIRNTHRALSEGLFDKWPVTILVNQGSESRRTKGASGFDSSLRRETNNPLNYPAFLEKIERLNRCLFIPQSKLKEKQLCYNLLKKQSKIDN